MRFCYAKKKKKGWASTLRGALPARAGKYCILLAQPTIASGCDGTGCGLV